MHVKHSASAYWISTATIMYLMQNNRVLSRDISA